MQLTTVIAAAILTLGVVNRAAAEDPSAWSKLSAATRTRAMCSIVAAMQFDVPANLLLAVAEQEGGSIGQWVKNTNGTFDVGPMQFNTAYLRTLERYGITPAVVEASGCYPYELAAWRLRGHLSRDAGDIWTRAANYHSRSPAHNARYRAAIQKRAARWAHWLAQHFAVRKVTEVAKPAPSPPSPPPRVALLARAASPHSSRLRTVPVARAPAEINSPVDQQLQSVERDRSKLLAFLTQAYAVPDLSSHQHATQPGR